MSCFPVDELQRRIDEVLMREEGSAVWGYLVHSVGLNRDVASNANADVALVPASNVKLMSCLAALLVSHVGPRHRFETSARLVRDDDGEAGEELRSCLLCVTPTGDPTLTSEQMRHIVRGAAAEAEAGAGFRRGSFIAGGKHVRVKLEGKGKPWVDEGPHPTWEVGDLGEKYAAPPSRTVLDSNTDFETEEDARHDPCSRFIARVAQIAEDVANEDEEETGAAGMGSRHQSPPVASLVRTALEESDNLYAEQLLRAASGGRDSGRWLTSWSAVHVNKHCSSSSSVPRRVRLVDASGLSRHNLAPPRAFVALLLGALEGSRQEKEEDVDDERDNYLESSPCRLFLDSLPLAGRTGTLSRRLVDTAAEGNVRAKTGSMIGVAALSGFFQPLAHAPRSELGAVVFSIIANNGVVSATKLRAVIDEIVELVALAR